MYKRTKQYLLNLRVCHLRKYNDAVISRILTMKETNTPGKWSLVRKMLIEGARIVSLKFEFEDCGLFLRVQVVEIFFL